jgi:hypothetical protein
MKKYKSYLVQFVGNGYFADKQYFDYWSFTNDIVKAKRYKTPKTATNRVKKATLSPLYKILDTKVIEELITFVIDPIDGSNKMITTMTVISESKKADIVEITGSTIENLVDSEHDPFWD